MEVRMLFVLHTMAFSRVSVSRANTLRGREVIADFFFQKRNLRMPQGSVLRVSSTVQQLSEPGLIFLIVVSKRTAKRAHDRNQLKRWIRAAVGETSNFHELEALALTSQLEITLLFSPTGPPSPSVNWDSILRSVRSAAQLLYTKLQAQYSTKETA